MKTVLTKLDIFKFIHIPGIHTLPYNAIGTESVKSNIFKNMCAVLCCDKKLCSQLLFLNNFQCLCFEVALKYKRVI